MASYSSAVIYDHNSPTQVMLSDSLITVDKVVEHGCQKAQSHYNGSYLDFDNDGKAEVLLSFQGDPQYINITQRSWNPDIMQWDTTEQYDIPNNHSFIALIENDNIQTQQT